MPEEETELAGDVVVAALVAEVAEVADDDDALVWVAVERSGTLVSCACPSSTVPSTSSVIAYLRDILAMLEVGRKLQCHSHHRLVLGVCASVSA